MSSRRKPRPLNRDKQTYRDDRLYIIACDDTYAPKQYFGAYEAHFLRSRLQVYVIPTTDGTSSAAHVVNRLIEMESEEYDEKWLLLDTDHYIRGSHKASFLQAIHDAKQRGIHIAVSRPCFEFWLLLHHLAHDDERLLNITNAKSTASLLKEIHGTYHKDKVDMARFPLESVVHSVREGRLLDSEVGGGDIPDRPTSRVYRLWESIVRNASLPQLPEEWAHLKTTIDREW